MSQNFELGPSFYFMTLIVKNSEKINFENFYISCKDLMLIGGLLLNENSEFKK